MRNKTSKLLSAIAICKGLKIVKLFRKQLKIITYEYVIFLFSIHLNELLNTVFTISRKINCFPKLIYLLNRSIKFDENLIALQN